MFFRQKLIKFMKSKYAVHCKFIGTMLRRYLFEIGRFLHSFTKTPQICHLLNEVYIKNTKL